MDKRYNKSKILILGVTAVGKGTLAFDLARRLNAEIISIDSMKVYRRMDIGTAKPNPQRRGQIPYHLLDVVEPSESFSVDRFLELTQKAVADIQSRGKTPIASGGTAMYIKALLYGLFEAPPSDSSIRDRLRDEIAALGLPAVHKRLAAIDTEASSRIHPNDEKRIIRALEVWELTGKPISALQQQWSTPAADDWFIIGLRRDKDLESKRINLRARLMAEKGLLDEVKSLLAEPIPLSPQARVAIGYAEIIEHLEGRLGFDEAIEQIKINTRKLAKAQRTWFKTFRNVHWIDIPADADEAWILDKALDTLAAAE
ncbi:MAG: tRNA (adenosine(37)-N6)-dimethylallyltransferase MiaA [Sedimentisphaerales bacterium]|nr:tRNA (adenosine(37)-N6)-dimethylallyltransferase MiaA [Sedimentisphaerales bacterium]